MRIQLRNPPCILAVVPDSGLFYKLDQADQLCMLCVRRSPINIPEEGFHYILNLHTGELESTNLSIWVIPTDGILVEE